MRQECLLLQDLAYLSEGLEGRSKNPVAVLFDTLLHPNADFGYEFPPVLQWKKDKQQHIPHLVLGRATPGGAWHVSSQGFTCTPVELFGDWPVFWSVWPFVYVCHVRQWKAPCWLSALVYGWSFPELITGTWRLENAGIKGEPQRQTCLRSRSADVPSLSSD